jgi:uncharacterized membrane protein
MDNENRLKELEQIVEDTHRMVEKLYKYQRRAQFFRVLKLVLIIVIIVGAYYAVLPIFDKLVKTYNDVQNGVVNVQNFGSNFSFPGFGSKEE